MAGSPCELPRRSATAVSAGRLGSLPEPAFPGLSQRRAGNCPSAATRTSVLTWAKADPIYRHLYSSVPTAQAGPTLRPMFLSSSARLVDAGRRGPGRCRTFPGHRGTGSSVRARRRGLGEAVLGDGGTIITQGFDRYPVVRMQSVPVDAHGRCRSRPVRSSRSSPEGGTGTATGRPTLCATAANRHSQPACSPYPGRWQRLAGTSAYTAVRRRSVLRCSGRANHQDPVMSPNLPGGKPGSGPPFGRKIQKRSDMGETAWGAARRNRTEGRSSVSTEQRGNLEAILGQSALPPAATSASSGGCSES
jgi:hypothetical protein